MIQIMQLNNFNIDTLIKYSILPLLVLFSCVYVLLYYNSLIEKYFFKSRKTISYAKYESDILTAEFFKNN